MDPYLPADEVASLLADQIKGKTILITGVSPGGIGAEAARVIAKHGAGLLILAGRDKAKVEATQAAISAESPSAKSRSLILDLASLESVRKAATEVNAYPEAIDVLINNAAIMALPTFTPVPPTNCEAQFVTNHLGPFLFTNLIRSKLAAATSSRVVNVSSAGHRFSNVRFDDVNFDEGKAYTAFEAYGQSKTASILFTVSLAEKWREIGVTSYAVHPGMIKTNLGRNMATSTIAKTLTLTLGRLVYSVLESIVTWQPRKPLGFKTIPQGASSHIFAAFSDTIKDQSGSYVLDHRLANDQAKEYALDKEYAERLWQLCEKILGQPFA